MITRDYLREWCKRETGITGSISSWQGHLILLRDCGLVITYREAGQKEGRRNPTFRRVPEYIPELLERADRIAGVYLSAHINLTHLSKTDVIRVRGKAVADCLYQDGRTICGVNQMVYEIYQAVLRELVTNKGFARRDELKQAVKSRIWAAKGFEGMELQGDASADERMAYREQMKWQDEIKKCDLRLKEMRNQLGVHIGMCAKQTMRRCSCPQETGDGFLFGNKDE